MWKEIFEEFRNSLENSEDNSKKKILSYNDKYNKIKKYFEGDEEEEITNLPDLQELYQNKNEYEEMKTNNDLNNKEDINNKEDLN
ncbi:MAG: hypothetical protein MJ252_17040, partial [archaeon]|nr:hypothetical protein [archaeon]